MLTTRSAWGPAAGTTCKEHPVSHRYLGFHWWGLWASGCSHLWPLDKYSVFCGLFIILWSDFLCLGPRGTGSCSCCLWVVGTSCHHHSHLSSPLLAGDHCTAMLSSPVHTACPAWPSLAWPLSYLTAGVGCEEVRPGWVARTGPAACF